MKKIERIKTDILPLEMLGYEDQEYIYYVQEDIDELFGDDYKKIFDIDSVFLDALMDHREDIEIPYIDYTYNKDGDGIILYFTEDVDTSCSEYFDLLDIFRNSIQDYLDEWGPDDID